jgi:magnesium-transporting ATPase (P-type)
LREPQLYQYTLNARPYRVLWYWVNFCDAIWQAAVIFFFAYFAYQTDAGIDQLAFGFSLIFSLMISSSLHVMLQTTRINLLLVVITILSFLLFLVFTLIYDATCVTCLAGQSPYYVSYQTFRQANFWFTNLLTIVTALLPRFIVKCLYNSTVNPLSQNIRSNQLSSIHEPQL